MNKPYWREETPTRHGRVISVRINDPRVNEINGYINYLKNLMTHLGNRIIDKGDINGIFNGDLCCVIRLKDDNEINY